jgi:hypothetical protein
MKNRVVLAGLVLGAIAGFCRPQDASAIPVFARKYGFNCTMCHSNMPRLNDFGQRYRMNGYQLVGLGSLEQTVLESPAPVALRTSAGYVGTMFNEAAGLSDATASDESDFRLNGLDLLSAGQLGRNIGYFMVYVPQIAAARGVAGQEGSLEMASIVFSNLASTWLNVRAGRFEPAFVPFSVKRQLSVSPYAVYDATFQDGPALSGAQSGVEISGHGPSRFQYAAGLVDGGGTNVAIDSPADVYLRLAQVIGAGEGQTAGQRLGVMGYLGRARPVDLLSVNSCRPADTLRVSATRRSFYRVGLDACLNLGHANLALQYLMAGDDWAFWGEKEHVIYSGGFGELSWLPRTEFVGFARVDYLDAPKIDSRDRFRLTGGGRDYGDLLRLTVGGRYYIEDNVVIHGEYSHRSEKSVRKAIDDATESFVTARIDFAF